MGKNNKTIVYWAPIWDLMEDVVDWNMLYSEPENLFSVMLDDRTQRAPGVEYNLPLNKPKTEHNHSMFRCPAISNITKNTFLLRNTIETHLKIDPPDYNKKTPPGITPELDDTRIKYHSKNYTNCNLIHQSNLSGSELFVYALRWIFFTEDDSLNMNLTSPWFTNSPHMKYGSIIPGQFDVGKWFRSITLEYNLWPDNNEFKILADEIAGYVSFETPNDVELVRFQMNEPLTKYSRSTATSSSWYTNVPLLKRYKMFENSKMKRLIMKEIKKCII
jgi:hypothetical protein|tara:strand:- start:84 stop:908 length:825 start_codon:yes stop_codon:yes gene_type:complete